MTSALKDIFQQTWENGFQVFSCLKKDRKTESIKLCIICKYIIIHEKYTQMNSADLGMILVWKDVTYQLWNSWSILQSIKAERK